MTLSRASTLSFQFPRSRASAQKRVACAVVRHSNSRDPVGTPAIGTRSDNCFQAEDCIRGADVTGVQTCALPIFIASASIHDPNFRRTVVYMTEHGEEGAM